MTQSTTIPFPSEWISWHTLTFPKGRQWRQALPFALEEHLAADVQQLHIIPIDAPSQGEGRVAVIAQSDWQAFSAQHPDSRAGWQPDFLQLPWQAHQLTLLCPHQDRMIARWGEWEGYAGKPDVVITLLQNLPHQHFQHVICYGEPNTGLLPTDWSISIQPLSSMPPVIPTFNLRKNLDQPSWSWASLGAWKMPAVLLTLWLLLSSITSIIQTFKQVDETAHLNQQIQTLLNTQFPEIKRQVNVIAQAKTVAKDRLALQAQQQTSALLAIARLDALLVNFPPVHQIQIIENSIDLHWSTPLSDHLLNQNITIPDWKAQWKGNQRLSLELTGDDR